MRKALHRLVMATGELAVEDRGEHANSPDPNVALGNDQMGPAGSPAITQWHLEAHRRKVIRNAQARSEEHTSELQSRGHLVCRLLLEKKKKTKKTSTSTAKTRTYKKKPMTNHEEK